MCNLNSRNIVSRSPLLTMVGMTNVLKGLVTKTRKTNEMAAEWQS